MPEFNREQLDWLHTLIGSHRELQGKLDALGCPDEDPDATAEMYAACAVLADTLGRDLDMLGEPADLPTDAEVEAMYQQMGGEGDIPF